VDGDLADDEESSEPSEYDGAEATSQRVTYDGYR